MDIDSYYLIGHLFLLLAGAESMPSVSLVRVTSYRQCDDAQLFAQHACSGSDKQTASTYPLPTRSRCSEPQRILTLVDFHGLSRAEGPKGQTRSNPIPSCLPATETESEVRFHNEIGRSLLAAATQRVIAGVVRRPGGER